MISSESYEDIMDGHFKDNQHKEVYYYDSENYLIKKMNYFENSTSDKKWELFNVEKYQYVNSKKIVGIDSVYLSNGSYGTNFYKNPKKKTKIYSLNDEGYIENESSYILNPFNKNDSTLVDQSFKIYDKKGFIVEWRFSYFEKKLNKINKIDFKTKTEYNEFDEKGNWTKKTVMTNDNKYQIYIRKIIYE